MYTFIYFIGWSVRKDFTSILCLVLRCLPIVDVKAVNISSQCLHFTLSRILFTRKCFQTAECRSWLTSSNPSNVTSTGRQLRNPILMPLLPIRRIIVFSENDDDERWHYKESAKNTPILRFYLQMISINKELSEERKWNGNIYTHLFHELIRANIFAFDIMLQLEMSIHCRCNGNKRIGADFAPGLFQCFVQEKVLPNLRLSFITNILKAFIWYLGRKSSSKSHLQVFTYKRNIIHVWNWKQTAKLVLERATRD